MVALLMTAGADVECENEEIPDPEVGGDEGQINRRGLKPVDYADDNEQVRKWPTVFFSGNIDLHIVRLTIIVCVWGERSWASWLAGKWK